MTNKLDVVNFTGKTLYIGRDDFRGGIRIFAEKNEVYESIEVPDDSYIELNLSPQTIDSLGEVKSRHPNQKI